MRAISAMARVIGAASAHGERGRTYGKKTLLNAAHDPETQLLLDSTQPVAVFLVAVLHFIPDSGQAADIVARAGINSCACTTAS